MANLAVDLCVIPFKDSIIADSLETKNSPDRLHQCFEYGASAGIIKTRTDVEGMAKPTENSSYCILNDQGQIIKGKVPRDFVFYRRSSFSSACYKDWANDPKQIQQYAADRDAHLIGSAGAKDINRWKDICRTIEDFGLPLVEIN